MAPNYDQLMLEIWSIMNTLIVRNNYTGIFMMVAAYNVVFDIPVTIEVA